jgi:hypothetical protein
MEFHPQTSRQRLCARLLADGRVIPREGGAYPPPATWKINRCWPHAGRMRCLLRASVSQRAYFADVPADDLATIERDDGISLCLERFAGR